VLIETYPDRAAWLAARGGTRIGASEAAVVLGVSRYRTPWDLWEQRQPGAVQPAETEEQAGGHVEEPLVLERYQRILQRQGSAARVLRPAEALGVVGEVVIRHPVHEWATCTPDAMKVDDWVGWAGWHWAFTDGGLRVDQGGLAEAKSSRIWEGWGESGQELYPPNDGTAWPAPVDYVIQCYYQLEVTGLPYCDLVVQMPHFWDVRWYRFHRDPVLQAALLEQVGAWRERHLVRGEPPPVDGSDGCGRYLRRAFPDRLGRAATIEEAQVLEQVRAWQQMRDCADGLVAHGKNQLLASMQGVERITTPRLTFTASGRLTERRGR